MKPSPQNPEVFLTRGQLASILPISYQTLARWTRIGEGPPTIKVGRHVAYRVGDVREWLDRQKRGVMT